MRVLGTVDLEILHLAVAGGGRVDESGLGNSEKLRRLGVGRTLDALASLRDRGMLTLNSEDGSFSVTDAAYGLLWTENVPLRARVLRLLEIRSCSLLEMASILQTDRLDALQAALDELRKARLVMMSPRVRDGRPEKIYEVLPEGIGKSESATAAAASPAGTPVTTTTTAAAASPEADDSSGAQASGGRVGVTGMMLDAVDDISVMISSSETLAPDEKRVVSQRISGLRDMLERSAETADAEP